MPKKPSSRALTIIDLDQLSTGESSTGGISTQVENSPSGTFEDLGKRARAELEWIETAEKLTPVRAIFLGIILAQIRAGMARGKWGPWIQKHFGKKKTTAYKYLSIAKACVADARIQMPELIALPQLPMDFKPANPKDDAARGLKKIMKWVGKQSLQELYRLHASGKLQPGLIEKAARKVPHPEAARALAKTELSDWLEQGRGLLITENRCSLLLKDEVRKFAEGLDSMLEQWRRGIRKTLEA